MPTLFHLRNRRLVPPRHAHSGMDSRSLACEEPGGGRRDALLPVDVHWESNSRRDEGEPPMIVSDRSGENMQKPRGMPQTALNGPVFVDVHERGPPTGIGIEW